jgi:hypothetical protein
MRADKLSAWLERNRVGAHAIVLQHDPGVGELHTFATFPIDPLPDVEMIFNACADLADELEQAIRVSIVIVDEDDKAICRASHKQMPLEASSPDALKTADVSMGGIVAQLLRHIEQQQRAVTGSHLSIYNAFERTLTQLQKVVERQGAQIQTLTEALRDTEGKQSEETAEQREEAISRRQAWDKLGELLPTVSEFALKALAMKVSNGHAANTNGVGAVHGTASVVD